jgi:hypothetical protein
MSRQSSDAEPDVYVGLLFISVTALIVGCFFLGMQLSTYGWQMGN